MRNNSVLFLARRYLSGKRGKWIGKSHLLTVSGIALGVLALVAVSSVMNGLRNDMQRRIVGTFAEVRVSAVDYHPISDYRSVMAKIEKLKYQTAPVVRTELMIKNESIIVPTMSFGIDYAKHKTVSKTLHNYIDNPFGISTVRQGIISTPVNPESFETGGIILGAGLAFQLNAMVGDRIQLISPMFTEPTAFGLLPKIRTLTVSGIFAAGMPEYDQMYSYVPLEVGQYFRGYGDEVDYVEVKTGDLAHSKAVTNSLDALLPGYLATDWSSLDPSLYEAIRFEKIIMFIIMLFMYIIASFNLTGNMMKLIAQKKRELGLLKAIGYREEDLRKLFVINSLILSSVGIGIGSAIAAVFLFLQYQFGLIRLSFSATDQIILPVSFQWLDFVFIVIAAYFIAMLSVWLPIRNLRKINPVQLIRQNA